MSESKDSANFINQAREVYGRKIHIRKKMSNMGIELDIAGCFKGMPFYFESKHCNTISYKNEHPFTPIQIDELQTREKAGALCLGLLFHGNSKWLRIVRTHELKAHFNKNEFLQMEEFEWEKLRSQWIQKIQESF